MTESAVVHCDLDDSREAGLVLGRSLLESLQGQRPDAVLVMAARPHDYRALLRGLEDACRPGVMVGGTAVGGFTRKALLEGSVCAVGLRSTEMRFGAAVGTGIGKSRSQAARELIGSLRGLVEPQTLFRSAIVLIDARAADAEGFLEDLTALTGGTYQLFGGGATDDPLVTDSHLFVGTEVVSNAAVALEILSNKPLGMGVFHGWRPTSPPMRVTEAEGRCLISLNARPAVDAFVDHAEATGQRFDPAQPRPFFLANILGIQERRGHKLRVPLAVQPDGSIVCATEIPVESVVHVMGTSVEAATAAAARAIRGVRDQLGPYVPELTLFFDCLAARARQELGIGADLRTLENELGTERYVGFGTAGQLARAEGQFSGFHNSTSVVCVIPR